MNDNLLAKMSQDLLIFPFENENKQHFCARVIYSGMVLWMKAITLDNFEPIADSYHSVSKHHHYKRSEEILKHMLEFFPESRDWFFAKYESGDGEHPVHIIRDRLLRSEEIIELDFSNSIALSAEKHIRVSHRLVKHLGISSGMGIQYNGISALSECLLEIEHNHSLILDCLNFTESYFKQIKFTPDEWNTEKEYFDPKVRTDTFHYAWVDRAPNCDIYISRIASNRGNQRFFVEKKLNGQIMSHQIDDFIVQSGNYRRFLLALRHKYNNPLSVTVERYKDHFILKRYVKEFPFPEECVIQSYGWPVERFHDSLNWVFHNYLYEEIIKTLEILLIKVNEVQYE